jgi:hypothetical protein
MRGATIGSGIIALAVTACAAHQPMFQFPGETFPVSPFELNISILDPTLAAGQTITINYELTNVSSAPVSACANEWDDVVITDDRGGMFRDAAITLDGGLYPSEVFRLPPGHTLAWTRQVAVPTGLLGRFKLRGLFLSECWLWKGRVESEPVDITIVRPNRAG